MAEDESLSQFGTETLGLIEGILGAPLATPAGSMSAETLASPAGSMIAKKEDDSLSGAETVISANCHMLKVPQEQLLSDMRKTIRSGISKYIRDKIPTSKKKQYAEHFHEIVPPFDNDNYFIGKVIPASAPDTVTGIHAVELCVLGFDCMCSLKPSVSTKVAEQLLDEYFLDGFITADSPLIITQPDALAADNRQPGHEAYFLNDWLRSGTSQCISIFSLGYVKGMARASVAIFIVLYCFSNGIDLQAASMIKIQI